MRIPRPATIGLVVVALTLSGLIVARVSAQGDDSPTDHPPIVVPSAPVDDPRSDRDDDDDDDDDGFDKIQPRPRDIDDDDDDDDRDGPRDD